MNTQELLGMRLEDALRICREQKIEPKVIMTLPPKGRELGTVRVIRAQEGVLTVSRFQEELTKA